SPFRNYTEVFAPIPLSDDSSVEDTEETVIAQESHITISNIIEDLFLQVNNAACSRFIINRADVWDGALRGFRRSNYEAQNSMMVKFTDDIGVTEEGIDTGGPKREFLGLLMDHLHKRPIFEGPETQRFLKYDATVNVFFLL
ncbi:G2/M phase-specific E3 ubiquitin-protein ligase, partial [Acipenser oxyrinchus oxyrinchus]